MQIGVPKETAAGEKRVALVPEVAGKLAMGQSAGADALARSAGADLGAQTL